MDNKYVVAIYLRLSIDDKKVDSMSIESQRSILRKCADELDIANMEMIEFVDNGYSGTNFERPAVQELLSQVRAFKINCIMVKDFSRFGRNSLEVGYFTQQVFPLFNVRFISVNDHFDSNDFKGDTGGLNVAFKYLVNEYYSRDLSRKSKTAKYIKMRSGEYNAGVYCYGYKKGDNGEMVLDESVADNVRLIFKLSSQGKSAYEISKELFDRKIITPAQYKAQNGKKNHDISRCKYWVISKQVQTVANIDTVADLNKLQIQTERVIELEKQISAYQGKKQQLYEQLLMREITLDEYKSKKEIWDEKLQAVQQLYNHSCEQVEIMKIDSKTKSQMIQIAKDVSKENTLTQALADTLIEKIYIYPDKNIEIVWKIQDFCYSALMKN